MGLIGHPAAMDTSATAFFPGTETSAGPIPKYQGEGVRSAAAMTRVHPRVGVNPFNIGTDTLQTTRLVEV
jgi:hypothetical protein